VWAAHRRNSVRSCYWAIENSLHWVLDVTFGEDQSRLQTGHGAKNMAFVRHFAINPRHNPRTPTVLTWIQSPCWTPAERTT
jgi:predicted transposase YbfD/YdcC